MIEILGIHSKDLPNEELIQERIGDSWFSIWKTQHKNMRGDHARASLGGLLLLRMSGFDGMLHYSENGRPSFLNSEIDFSITHTDGLILCAVSKDCGLVGVDAEDLSRIAEEKMIALVNRWFGDAERKIFLETPTATTFLRLWTRKEAYVKRTGEGLRQLRSIDTFSLPTTAQVAFVEFWLGNTCVTLCADVNAEVCGEIRMIQM